MKREYLTPKIEMEYFAEKDLISCSLSLESCIEDNDVDDNGLDWDIYR